MPIPWDLEATPIQIKTDSTAGSNEEILVAMFDKDSNQIGRTGVRFSSSKKYEYSIQYCTGGRKKLPVLPPTEVDKIWTITKTETGITITCNGVEVVNYLFADSSNSNCVPNWGGDVVEQISFSEDTASDFYKSAGKGLNLIHTT